MTKLVKCLEGREIMSTFAPQLHPGKTQGGRRLAEVISRRKIKTTRNTFKKYD